MVDEDRIDGGGTGGVGMFSMTMGDDEIIQNDEHMAVNNPFGMEDEDDSAIINEDGFEEIKLQEKRAGSIITVNTAAIADNRETGGSEDTEDLNDWDLIDEVDVEVDKNGFRPPDVLNDPFKDKWRNIIDGHAKHSRYSNRRTWTLKPMIIKANDDCRQEVMAMQLIKRLQ